MKKKFLLFLSLFSLVSILPNYNGYATSYNNTISAITLYQEVRTYNSYQGNAIWVTAVKNGQQCSGYIYYVSKTLTLSGWVYYYSGELRPGPYAPLSVPVDLDIQ